MIREGKREKSIEEKLKKIKEMKRALLKVYLSTMITGEFKEKHIPIVGVLRSERKWLTLEERK